MNNERESRVFTVLGPTHLCRTRGGNNKSNKDSCPIDCEHLFPYNNTYICQNHNHPNPRMALSDKSKEIIDNLIDSLNGDDITTKNIALTLGIHKELYVSLSQYLYNHDSLIKTGETIGKYKVYRKVTE